MSDELSPRRKAGVLAICALSLFLVGLDITALNIALPSIQEDLDADLVGLQWALGAYTVVLASLLLLSGSVADRLGRRRTFVTGLSVFTAASAACSLAPSIEVLVAARVVQAIGGSMMNPVAMAIITHVYVAPRERAQAIGVWGATFGVSMALGPVVGGALVTAADWRAVFWLNLPIGLGAILLALRFVPESRAPVARRFDPAGQALVIVLLAATTFGIIEAPGRGLTSPAVVAAFAAAAGALAGILVLEPRRTEPLVDLALFRSRAFAATIALSVLAFATFGGFLLLTTLFLQEDRGLTPLDAGLALLPMAAMIAVVSPLAGRLVGRRGPALPLLLAGVCLTASCLMLTGLAPTTSGVQLAAAFALFGAGFGFVNPPITSAAVAGLPSAQAGVAAAMATTSRQVGQTLGVAVTGALLGARLDADGIALASHTAWKVLAAAGVTVLVLGVLATVRVDPPRTST